MKFIIPIFISFFLVSVAKSGETHQLDIASLKAANFDYRAQVLSYVLTSRCERYLPAHEAHGCGDAIDKMIEVMNFDVIFYSTDEHRPTSWHPSSFVFVTFKKELISTLSNPHTTEYLKKLNEGLFNHLNDNKMKFNLWELTLAYYGSEFKAAQIIASLFQDISNMKLHLAYLDKTRTMVSDVFATNRAQLEMVIDSINLIKDLSDNSYNYIFYPLKSSSKLNLNIYHYYVPMYLAMKLKSMGVSSKLAATAPLMLTLSYEFMTASSDYRFVFDDPQKITASGKIQDIYGGYSGAQFGIGNKNSIKSYHIIETLFSISTERALKQLIH